MAGVRLVIALMVVLSVTVGGKRVNAQIHHVVGGDSGWDPTSDLVSWSSGRDFRVGDKIWFTYAAAAQESIVEVKTMEEYLTCDVTNPIRMYTDGLDVVPLAAEGIRYFASGKLENCKNGLKLPVDVKPAMALAEEPTPSASSHLSVIGASYLFVLVLTCYLVL